LDWPSGLLASRWPKFDPAGYELAEQSMCTYGRANFSELLSVKLYKYEDLPNIEGIEECQALREELQQIPPTSYSASPSTVNIAARRPVWEWK
jgi:hypothetical protein